MAENPCWEGYEQIGMKKKNGKKVPNCVPIKRAKNLSTLEEQTQKIKDAALAVVAESNSEFSGTRLVTTRAALTIVERSLAKNETELFSVRKHRAITELSQYITLAQHNRVLNGMPEHTDLLPVAHPRSTRAHDMTTASLMKSRARWVTDDPSITDASIKTLLASALTAHPASAEYEYSVARLESFPEGQIPSYALLAALGDGNSSLARRARAMRQRRDRKGRFAEMGGGLRALIRRANGMIQNLNGRAVSQGIEGDTFDFETPDGKLFRVPAGNVEAIKAIIPSQQSKDGYSKGAAKTSAKDPVINEADLVEIDAPEGFRRDDAWSPKKEDRDIYGENVDLGTKYTDDAYDVIKMENNQFAKDQFEVAQQREREGQNVVAQGEGANGELDPNKPVFLVNRRGQEDSRPFAAVQSWAEVQDFIGQDEPRFENNENPSPDRMGGGDDGGDEPPAKPVAELPEEEGNDKFPKGTNIIPGVEKPSRSEMREYRKQLKDFRKNGGLLPLDPRKTWALLPDGSVVDANSGEVLRNDKREVFLPEEEEVKGIGARIREALAPKGAYEVDRDEYKPEGAIDGQESPDFTDDPAELAQKFDQEELQDSLKDAVEGTPEQPAPAFGQLPFQEGDEIVPAEALYNALKEQGVDVDKFLNDIYNQMAGRKQEQPADADVPEAPVAKISDKELPPLIEGMTPEEQRDFIDNGDYKKYLPKNVEHDVPEGYAGLSNDPFNADEAPVPADAPEGFSNDPVDIALGYDKEELKGELRRAIEPGGDMPGQGLLAQETPEGEEYVASVPGEAIRDALQLQGEDTNALIQDIYNEGKDNEPSNQEVADALEGENVQEEPAKPEESPAQDAQGPDANQPKAGLPADNEIDRVQGEPEAAQDGAATAGVGSQEADLAMGEPRREMVRAADLQPGDIAVRDNEFFVIEEVAAPAELSEGGQKDKGRNRINVKGYYPGHQTQDRDWFANGNIEVIRGVAAPAKGDAEPLNKPKLEDYVGGPKEMKKIDGEWGAKNPAVQEKYAADLAAHKAAVQAAGANFVDPTKVDAEGPVAKAVLADAMPDANAPFIAKFKASDLQVGDVTVKDHFRITNITRGENGKILVEGHYPGQGLQTKQWWPNTGIEVIRGIDEANAPQLGEGSLHRPAGEGPRGNWFPVDDAALNAEHEARIAEAKARWEAPADLPIVSAAQAKNDDPLEENIKLPPKPREPAYPAFMGKFAEWAREAQGNWAEFKNKLAGQDLIVFDFETTGIDVKDGNEPWQIAAVKMRDGKIVDRINIFMNPGKSLKDTYAGQNAKDPDGNLLTDEFFADKPTQAEGLQQFLDWAGANPLAIAQNAKFDDEIMKRKAAELGLNWEPAGMADTMGMAAEIFKDAPGAPDRKGLGAIAEFLEIKNENWHDGLNDAEVTAQAFTKLIDLAASGDFGVAALDADAQQAAYDAKMADLQPRIDEFNKAAADYVAKKALRDGLAGKPVDLAEIQKEIPAALPEGPIDNVGAMDNPEQVPAVQPDLVDVQVMSAFPEGKMRIVEPGWADDFENVDVLDRGQIHANSLRPGDFVHPKKDDPEFMQIVSIRGGEEFGVEEWKRRVVMQNADGEQRVAIWNQNAFLDEVRRPKNRAALAGEPLPEVQRTPEEMNMQAVSVARGNAVLEITPDGEEFVMKARLLDDSGNEIYAVEGRFLSPEGAEAEGKALLRRAGAEFADRQRTNEGQPASKAKSVAIGNEPANVDQLPVVEMVENLEVGEGQNEITPRVEEGNVIYKSDAKLVDDGDVVAQVVEDFPSKKEASEGGRDNIDAMAVAFAEKFAQDREALLLRSEGRGRKNLPPIPAKYRRQVYIRALAGLYADRNGDPLAAGDKVIHQNPQKARDLGEGVVVRKVQGNNGGLQRKGVVYVDYVMVQYAGDPQGVLRKHNARMLEHIDKQVAQERFEAEPKINWMNPEEKAQAVVERNKKPRKGGNEAIDAADAEVEEIVAEIEEAVAPEAARVEAPVVEEAPTPEPEAPAVEEAVAPGAVDAIADFKDPVAVREALVNLGNKLFKYRAPKKERAQRWTRRYIDEMVKRIDAGETLDRLDNGREIRNALWEARSIKDDALRGEVMGELEKLRDSLARRKDEIKEERRVAIGEKYKNPLPADIVPAIENLKVENALNAIDEFVNRLPDGNDYDVDRPGYDARRYVDIVRSRLAGMGENDFDLIDTEYLDNATAYLRRGQINAEQVALADELEKLAAVFKEKAAADSKVRQQMFIDRLAEPIDEAVWPTEANLNKDAVNAALDEVIRRLPQEDERKAANDLRSAAERLRTFKSRLQSAALEEVDVTRLKSAAEYLRQAKDPVQDGLADKIEGIAGLIDAKRAEILQGRIDAYKARLDAPIALPDGPEDVNRDQLVSLFEDLKARLGQDDESFVEFNKRRARIYAEAGMRAAEAIDAANPDAGLRNFDDQPFLKIVDKLNTGDDSEKALAGKIQLAYEQLLAKKNQLNAVARENFLARRDLEIPADAWPRESKESREDFIAAAEMVKDRLPVDVTEEADARMVDAAKYLEQFIEELNGQPDPLLVDRNALQSAIQQLRLSPEDRYQDFANNLQGMDDFISERLMNRPIQPFAGVNLEEVDPIELAEKRIAANENAFKASENIKNYFADEKLFADNPDLVPFQQQIQEFFNGDEKALANLDMRARQALAQHIAADLRGNKWSGRDAENVERTKEMISLLYALRTERDVYQPQRENLGEVGNRLLAFDPEKFLEAAQKTREGKEVMLNGQGTGFSIRAVDGGVNAAQNFFATDIATGQVFIFKKEKTKKQARAEYETARVAAALGITGRVHTELHPLDSYFLVQTFAGDTVRAQKAVRFREAKGRVVAGIDNAADRVNLVDVVAMQILNSVINNTDRHDGNFFVANADVAGVPTNGNENLYIYPIDHGYAVALNDGATTGLTTPFDFLEKYRRSMRDGNDLYAAVAKKIGGEAYKELVDMTIQQAIQYLERVNGGELRPEKLKDMIDRMNSLRGVTAKDWNNWIAGIR
jgi:DNA polymerase III epsilon subunit-like protein